MTALFSRSATGLSLFEIRLDNDVVVLRGGADEAAGVVLSGKVVLALQEKMNINDITLILTGTRRLRWSDNVITARGLSQKVMKSEEKIFERKWSFLPETSNKMHTIAAGNYEYSFSETLSGDTVESVEGMCEGQVFYRMRAVIERPRFSSDIIAKRAVRVVRTLSASALEHTQTMCVENIWPNKCEYSISVPNKAIVFGSHIPINIVLLPLLKGLQIESIKCELKELRWFSIGDRSQRHDVHNITSAEYNGFPEIPPDENDGKWMIREKIPLPRSLAKCQQDSDVKGIKVRHKVKFVVALHNPDGHISELRASLPIMLFIPPNLAFTEDNELITDSVHGSSESSAEQVVPPTYEDHIYDRLWDDLDPETYASPFASGANTPLVSSRNNSQENLSALSGLVHASLRGTLPESRFIQGPQSGASSPAVGSGISSAHPGSFTDFSTARWSRPRSRVVTPGASGGSQASDDEHHVPTPDNSSEYFTGNGGEFTPNHTRHSSNDFPAEPNVDLAQLNKVPSYTTAMRNSRNTSFVLGADAPLYTERDIPSRPSSRSPSGEILRRTGSGSSDELGVVMRNSNGVAIGRVPAATRVDDGRVRLMRMRARS